MNIKDLIISLARKELSNENFEKYFIRSSLIDFLTSAFNNSSKQALIKISWREINGSPDSIKRKFSIIDPSTDSGGFLIHYEKYWRESFFEYLQKDVREIYIGGEVAYKSPIQYNYLNINDLTKILSDFNTWYQVEELNQLAIALLKVINSDKQFTFYLMRADGNVEKKKAKIYPYLSGNQANLMIEVKEGKRLQKLSLNAFLNKNIKIVKIKDAHITLFQTYPFSEEEIENYHTETQQLFANYYNSLEK